MSATNRTGPSDCKAEGAIREGGTQHTPTGKRRTHRPRANIIKSKSPPTTHTQGGTRDSHPELDGTGGGEGR
jgi:hypothetical protein